MITEPIAKGTEVRVCTTNGGEAYGTLERDYVPTYAVWFKPNHGGNAYVITAQRLRSIEPAKESERPGYHCNCWDDGACCHCGQTGENGNCIPTAQQHLKPCKHD